MTAAAVERAPAAPTFEERLTREASRFELKPLVDLLRAHGYPRELILCESSSKGRGTSIVQAVTFRERPVRGVLVTLNIGLLGDNSLLPSYFQQVIEQSPDPD